MTPLTIPEVMELLKMSRGRMRGLLRANSLKTFTYSPKNARQHLMVEGDELIRFVTKHKFPAAVIKAVKARAKQ